MKEVGKSRQQTEGFGGGVSGSLVWCCCDDNGGVVLVRWWCCLLCEVFWVEGEREVREREKTINNKRIIF